MAAKLFGLKFTKARLGMVWLFVAVFGCKTICLLLFLAAKLSVRALFNNSLSTRVPAYIIFFASEKYNLRIFITENKNRNSDVKAPMTKARRPKRPPARRRTRTRTKPSARRRTRTRWTRWPVERQGPKRSSDFLYSYPTPRNGLSVCWFIDS